MSENKGSWSEWLNKSRFAVMTEDFKEQTLSWLDEVRDTVLDRANLKPDDTLLDIGTGTGLIAFEAHKRLKEMNHSPKGFSYSTAGKIIASDAYKDCLEECYKNAQLLGIENEIEFIQSDASDIKLPDNSVDVIVVRSVLVHILDKPKVINEFFRILKQGGRVSIFEPIFSRNTQVCDLITPANFPNYAELKEIEKKITSNKDDTFMNFDENSLKRDFEKAGFKNTNFTMTARSSEHLITEDMIDPWFDIKLSPGQVSLKTKFLRHMSENEIEMFIEKVKNDLCGREVTMNVAAVFLSAEKE